MAKRIRGLHDVMKYLLSVIYLKVLSASRRSIRHGLIWSTVPESVWKDLENLQKPHLNRHSRSQGQDQNTVAPEYKAEASQSLAMFECRDI
jgi:hypothetical protein